MQLPVLAIVVPCYNEQECIELTSNRLIEVLKDMEEKMVISSNSFILCVDDGSSDDTWNIVERLNVETSQKVKGIKFSRNFGNQKALLAGLYESDTLNADCIITIDADLQQDENKIIEFVEKYKNGAQIVCGIRNDRNTDGFLKKTTALAFYKFMNLLGVNIKVNHSDYRLIGSQALKALKSYHEVNLFLRGMFHEMGFKKDYVYFDVKPREYGKSKFTPFSLFALALQGITSFSIVPLRLVFFVGIFMAMCSFLLGLSAVFEYQNGKIVPGWTTIVVALGFIGGIQILCIGIIGEYLGQLFHEVKARPRYIIETKKY